MLFFIKNECLQWNIKRTKVANVMINRLNRLQSRCKSSGYEINHLLPWACTNFSMWIPVLLKWFYIHFQLFLLLLELLPASLLLWLLLQSEMLPLHSQLLPLLYLQPVCEELSAKNSVPCTKISCSLTLSTIDRAVCKEQRLLSQDLLIPQFLYSWSGWSVVELVCPGYSCSHLCPGYPGCSKSGHRTCWKI